MPAVTSSMGTRPEAVHSDVEASDSRVRFQIDPMTHQLTLHQSLADGRMLRLF